MATAIGAAIPATGTDSRRGTPPVVRRPLLLTAHIASAVALLGVDLSLAALGLAGARGTLPRAGGGLTSRAAPRHHPSPSGRMRTTTTIALWLMRLTGIFQLALGLFFWAHRALSLRPLHMAVGMVFVLTLWLLAGLAARAGLRWWLVLAAVGWGLVVPAFGILQLRLLPGSAHWVVQAIHLLIGIAAMAVGDRLGRFVRAERPPERAQGAARTMPVAAP